MLTSKSFDLLLNVVVVYPVVGENMYLPDVEIWYLLVSGNWKIQQIKAISKHVVVANLPGGWKKLLNMSRSQARPTPGCIFITFLQSEHPKGTRSFSGPSQGPKKASERLWDALRGPERPWHSQWEALRGPSGLQPWRWSPALLPGWLRQQYQMHWGTEADKVSSWKSCKIPKPPMSHKSHLSDKCLLFSTQIQDTCRFKSEFLFSPINIVWLSQSGCETLITLEKTGTQNRAVEILHCSLCLSKQNYLHYLKKLLHIILKDEAVAKVHQLIFSRGAAEATCRTECTKDEEMEKRDKFEVGGSISNMSSKVLLNLKLVQQ